MYSWGDGQYGKLGLGSNESKWEPGLISFNESDKASIIGLSCGSHHSVVIKGNFD